MLVTIRPANPGSPQAVNVCTMTVQMDLCVGCGICVPVCPTGTLTMTWNSRGEYIPVDAGNCRKGCHVCVDACPFLDHSENENTLARMDYGEAPNIQHRSETGHYLSSWVGYVADPDERWRGTSGGLGRWILCAALREGVVDRVLCVTADEDPSKLFRYSVLSAPEQVLASAKSAYYPLEMSEVVSEVLRTEARYAFVGVPCFIKGLKLAMLQNRKLKKRVAFTVALTCGQTKSRFYSDYLVRMAGHAPADAVRVSFREKDSGRPASDLRFQVSNGARNDSLYWTDGYSEPYNSGQFKPNCCNYCDDIFGETADVSLMDAWLPSYQRDGRGTSIVVVRAPAIDRLVRTGIAQGMLSLRPCSIEDAIASQEPVISDKRRYLAYRLWLADHRGKKRPAKRVEPGKPSWLLRRVVDTMEQLRVASFTFFPPDQEAGAEALSAYKRVVAPYLRRYYFWRRTYSRVGRWVGRVRRLLRGYSSR